MLNKISVGDIVKDHVANLRNNKTNRLHYPDIFLFFLFPAILSGIMTYSGIFLNNELVNALITSFSIFSALPFNLLLLVYDISGRGAGNPKPTDLLEIKREVQSRELLREIYVNVSFSILISTISVVVLLTYFLKTNNCNLWKMICLFEWLPRAVIYYLSIQFLLTIFMVLKRVYKLLAKAFE
ncbi:MAG: hypothetical protein KME14_25330 [Tildeniella torsiva UHER 1998/13D]|jgi:hypothetical protein|nr:hypothetical protein [Tildeniella torsiva UHER 1998/13D]